MSTEQTVKKTLAGKYTKFMVYGFKLAQSLKDQDLINDEVYNYMMKEQNMYGTVDAQTEFFESFFEDMKSSAKLMKQQIRQHNKPAKAKKEKVVDPDAPKAKRGRKKKEVVDNSTPEEKLVADIVAAAKSETIEPVVEEVVQPVVEDVVEPVVPEKPKRGRKSKKQVVEEKPEVLEEPVKIKEEKMEKTPDAPVKQKRAAAPKKTTKKKAKEPEQAPETPPIEIKPVVMTEELKEEVIEDDDEEIETTVYVEDNVEYLLDNKNNIYHRNTFDELGKLNTETNRIEFTHPHLMENIVDEN